MFRLFHRIRKGMFDTGQIRKYLIYAIGEILLVMIGIILALQVSNWNENIKNRQKERRYLTDLQEDLRQDSLVLQLLKNNFQIASNSKSWLVEKLNQNSPPPDSLKFYLESQYAFEYDFVPQTATIEELKGGSDLNLISNTVLRRRIVQCYNNYADFRQKLELGERKAQELADLVSRKVRNIDHLTDEEANGIFKDNYLTNKLRYNYLYTISNVANRSFDDCLQVLELIQSELTPNNP